MNQTSPHPLPSHHQAWTWERNGTPRSLTLQRMALPTPANGQVLVRNAVIGLNPVDWKLIESAPEAWREGHIPGVDAAGDVVSVGADVSAAWIGRRVAYHTNLQKPGSFAEFTAVDARALLRVPDAVDFEMAASVPCPALTAFLAIEKVPVQRDQPVLISGAGGAVGNYLVQFAAMRGFIVTAMAHPRHWDRLRTLGAAACLASPAEDAPLPTGQQRFYAVIDSVNAEHAARMADSLLANGHLVCIQGRPAEWVCPPFGRTLSMHEVALGALHVYGDDEAWSRLVAAGEQMLQQIAAGALSPEARVVRPFDVLPQCLEDLRNRQFSGKALVRVRPEANDPPHGLPA